MRVTELLESSRGSDNLLITALLRKLLDKGESVMAFVRIAGNIDKATHKRMWKSIASPITKIEIVGTNPSYTRVWIDGPAQWVDLNPDDDEVLTIKKQKDGSWLLSNADGSAFET